MKNYWYGGEGSVPAPHGDTEADRTWIQHQLDAAAKPCGPKPKVCFGTTMHQCAATKVVKRSLYRACRRAHRMGTSWYQGRCYLFHQFPQVVQQKVLQELSQYPHRKPLPLDSQSLHVAKRRLKIITWNPGGLSLERFDEVRQWLLQQGADVVFLVETRWQYTQEWQDQHWNCIHSGGTDSRSSGIMCLISRRLARLQQIRWIDVVPGRLLHVQLQFKGRSIDVLGCYQFSNTHTKQRHLDRQTWWNQLDKCVSDLSRRNLLVVAGDFNCSVDTIHGHVGHHAYSWQGKIKTGADHADKGAFAALLRHHGLVALNSWDATQGPTYVKGSAHSRIDFILVRKQMADGLARSAKHVWEAPFLAPKPDGHAPIFAHVPYNWHPAVDHAGGQGVTAHQRQRGRDAWTQSTADWDSFLHHSCMALQHTMNRVPASDAQSMDQLNTTLLQSFNACFPTHRPSQVPPAWLLPNPALLNKWQHRALPNQRRCPSLHNVFRYWFHATRYSCLQRCQRKYAHHIRKIRFHALLNEATQAAAVHDSFRLFSVINKYAPKAARRRMQIRNQRGGVATPAEELAILKQYVTSKWEGPLDLPRPLLTAPGIPFSVAELEHAISLIPGNKAVALPYAPGIAWKAHASTFAMYVYQALETWWHVYPPHVPQDWKDGWLILIPKPNKAPTSPKQLRPLAMQHPIGKCILGLITQKAQATTFVELSSWPLWAYMRGRSTLDALLHVANHCKTVRSLIQSQRYTAFRRVSKVPTFKTCGGMQMFLDIDNAFDAVCREKLFGKLFELGIDPGIISIMTSWHCGTQYHLFHLGEDHAITVGKGLRQGCRAAPYLWNCFVALCLKRLAQRLDPKFIRENTTIYADDMHIGGIFHNSSELTSLSLAFGIFLDTLREFELAVNPAKSNIILAMAGTAYRADWKRLTQRDSTGLWVKIDLPDGSQMKFPMVKSTKYLGAIVSYGPLEDQTLKYRVQMAKISFQRLRKWLSTHNGLPTRERFKLWHSCVLTVLQYGLLATGLTDRGLRTFQQTAFSMIRIVLHDHSFLTGITHSQALARHHIEPPIALLRGAALTLRRTVNQRLVDAHRADIVHLLNWQPLEDLTRRLDHWLAPGPASLHWRSQLQAHTINIIQCAYCDFTTDHSATLRRHCTEVHGIRVVRSHHVNIADFAEKGMPQCKRCHQSFTSWRAFWTHIQRGCQALYPGPTPLLRRSLRDTDRPPGRPIVEPTMSLQPERAVRGSQMLTDDDLQVIRGHSWGTALLTIITDREFHRLHHEQDACQYLTEFCGICGLHVGRLQSMNLHMRTFHAEYWPYVTSKSVQLSNLHSLESPCCCCGAIFRSQHTCPVWTQVAILLLYGGGLEGHSDAAMPHSPLRCELCHEVFADSTALTGHLHAEHGLVATLWNQSRDSIDNSPACAHCGCVYTSMTGLRSHISQGRCPMYNPEATPETLPIHAQWLRFCVHGKLLELYRDPMTKLRLTLHCQCCDRRFQRSMDLSLHLQTAHAAIWHAAQGTIGMLVEALYAKCGCVCNPSTSMPRVQHVLCSHQTACHAVPSTAQSTTDAIHHH